ncbi:MAG TPA: hypothetical protein VMH50_02540 [Thermoleophilia bacterium]|nr:hypothetical protein [Thermoleophilia bacterium]
MSEETRSDEDRGATSPGDVRPSGSEPADASEPADREASAGEPADGEASAAEPADEADSGGLRLVGAIVTLPWVLLYGVTGVWAVTLAAQSASRGLKQIDAGYTRYVTPLQLGFVGALLLAGFAVTLGCGLLLLFRRRSAMAWLPLLLVAIGLTAGALWAGIRGGLHPLLWVFFFFGLVYVTVMAAVRVLHVTRTERRGTIAPP